MRKVTSILIRLLLLLLLLGRNCIGIQAFVTPVPSIVSLTKNNCARKVNIFEIKNGKEKQETTNFQSIEQKVENILRNDVINASNEGTAKQLLQELGKAIDEMEYGPELGKLARLQGRLDERLKQFESKQKKAQAQYSSRAAGVDYGIKNIGLKYKDDFIRFRDRVFDLFQ